MTGAATVTAIGANSVTLDATRPGEALVRVHFTPYWTLATGQGCVRPAGQFTEGPVSGCAPGPAQLTIRFALTVSARLSQGATEGPGPHNRLVG